MSLVEAFERSFAAIGEYVRDKGRLVLDTLDVDGAVAYPATIRRVLVEVDPADLQEAITAWSLAQLAARDRPPAGDTRLCFAVSGAVACGFQNAASAAEQW